jgi:hypothetical protein
MWDAFPAVRSTRGLGLGKYPNRCVSATGTTVVQRLCGSTTSTLAQFPPAPPVLARALSAFTFPDLHHHISLWTIPNPQLPRHPSPPPSTPSTRPFAEQRLAPSFQSDSSCAAVEPTRGDRRRLHRLTWSRRQRGTGATRMTRDTRMAWRHRASASQSRRAIRSSTAPPMATRRPRRLCPPVHRVFSASI